MAVTWSIKNLEYNNDSDKGVTKVHWVASDTETIGSGNTAKDYIGKVTGVEKYTPDSSDAGYIALESLTESDIVTWVKTSLTDAKVTEIETKVAAEVVKSKTPTQVTGVPWTVAR
tara:strand:- start:168 stop:512 length:345 start_codon:yes stop_codon:yes gene_type:complete